MAKKQYMTAAFEGANELNSAFTSLSLGMRNRALKKAITKGARLLVRPIRRATPKSKRKTGAQAKRNPPGTTRKSTGVVYRKYRSGEIQAAYVGHAWPKGAAAHLSDEGTANRTNKKGAFRGHVTGGYWFTPAFRSQSYNVQATVRRELRLALEAERQRAARKARQKAIASYRRSANRGAVKLIRGLLK